MPEVPELLTLRYNLLKRFKDRKLVDFKILREKNLKIPKSEIISAVHGAALQSINRSGKILVLNFDNGQFLGVHLMSSGRPYLLPTENEVSGRSWEMIFEGGTGFGIKDPSGQTMLILNPVTSEVPDVLTDQLTFEYLKSVLRKNKTRQIKPLLTNAKYVRGIGNAYVDEILWQIKVSPASIACWLPDEKIYELIAAINSVLLNGEKEIRKVTGNNALMVEKRDFMNVHNHKRKTDPNGDEILKGEVANAKTYWTRSQVLYDHHHRLNNRT